LSDPVTAALLDDQQGIIHRLSALIAAPSVSTDPAFAEGMKRARAILMARLREAGFNNVAELPAPGHAAVTGEWLGAPGKPTLLIYGHYDVQPPDPLDLWQSPPFELTQRDGRLYGRGASDDKGPMCLAIEVLAAFLKVEGKLPVNVKLLLEGEEECGSPSLPGLLRDNLARLQADAVLSADGARWRADLPTMTVGTRGNAGFEFTLTTAAKDLHSGRYGGAVPNALHAMARLIATLHDASGGTAVAGYLNDAVLITAEERASLAAIPFDDAQFHKGLGTAGFGVADATTLERLWYHPTIEVNGLWGGYTGAGSKTVIPHEAHAKITLRLVPGQDPKHATDSVRAHLLAHAPPGATLRFDGERGASRAYALSGTHPLLIAAETALRETTGQQPTRVRMGATLPMAAMVSETVGLDTVMFSFSTSDEDYHAPNEFLRVSALADGARAWVVLLREAGKLTPADFARFRRIP
jgi:acetylornithine deacetylase/succinyl-diaminopimelate desuccinylase-like protein